MGRVGGSTTASTPALISTQTDSAVIRYTVADSFFVPRSCRPDNLRYLAVGPGTRVVAKLIEVDVATGREKPLLTFDSADPNLPRSDNYQAQSVSVCGRPWNFDFQNKAYYIEATLTSSGIAAISAAGIQMIQIDNFTRKF